MKNSDPTKNGHPLKPGGEDQVLYGDDLGVGALVGNYVIEELRSRGGFATIYRARHIELRRIAALKVLHRYLVKSPNMIQRFRQEAQAVNIIRHPNIVDIYEFGELTDGRPYFVMEWLDGGDLDQLLRSHGPMSLADTVALLEDLCAALSAAHAAGIIHRDLKASNVVLSPAGSWFHVKLVDFGIAKIIDEERLDSSELSTTGTRLGTPWNMAPEQIVGGPIDARTDVYALGVLLFQILTGRLPFRGNSTVEVEDMHLSSPPPKASAYSPVPPSVDAVIARCLEKSPQKRYATVAQVLHELRASAGRTAEIEDTVEQRAIGLFLEAKLDGDIEAASDEALDDIDRVLASGKSTCAGAGITLAVESGTAQLFVAPLASEPLAATLVREHVMRLALALRDQLAGRANACIGFAIVLRIGSVVVRTASGQSKYVGGELLAFGDWNLPHRPGQIVAHADVTAGSEGRFNLREADSGGACFIIDALA